MALLHPFRYETFALVAVAVSLAALVIGESRPAFAQATGSESIRVAVSYDEALRSEPVTGRLFFALRPDPEPVPRIAAYNSARRRVARVPFFAMDVEDWRPGEVVVLDASASGYPLHSLSDVEPGTYYVQAVLNVYTRFERSDGHVVYAPMDQWEGQRWAFKPGNFVSTPTEVRVDPANPETIRLTLTETIPPVEVPEDFDEQAARVARLNVTGYNTLLVVLTAVVVVGAMQVLGVILVAAMLVVPVAAASQVARSFRETTYLAVIFGQLSVIGGFVVAVGGGLPSGGSIVVVAIAIYLVAIAASGSSMRAITAGG